MLWSDREVIFHRSTCHAPLATPAMHSIVARRNRLDQSRSRASLSTCRGRLRRPSAPSHGSLRMIDARRCLSCAPSRSSLPFSHSKSCPSLTHPDCSARPSSSLALAQGSARYALYNQIKDKNSDITHTLPTSRLALYARLPPYCLQRYQPTSQRLRGDHSRDIPSIQGGSNLILLARRGDQLEKVAEAARAAHKASGVQQGGAIVTIQFDVSDRAQVAALWSKVPPNVDILGTYYVCSASLTGVKTALGLPQSTMQVLRMASTSLVISWIAISTPCSRRMSSALFLSLSYLSRVRLILPGTLRGKQWHSSTRQTSKPATLAMSSMLGRSQAGNRTQAAAYIVHPRLPYAHLPARSYERS
jgi:hypothetical protein